MREQRREVLRYWERWASSARDENVAQLFEGLIVKVKKHMEEENKAKNRPAKPVQIEEPPIFVVEQPENMIIEAMEVPNPRNLRG